MGFVDGEQFALFEEMILKAVNAKSGPCAKQVMCSVLFARWILKKPVNSFEVILVINRAKGRNMSEKVYRVDADWQLLLMKFTKCG